MSTPKVSNSGSLLGPQLDLLDELGRGAREERDQPVVLLLVVDDRALELAGVDVAHDAHREVGLLEDQRRRLGVLDALLQHVVELEQVLQLALEVGALGALGGGADDRAGALEVELGGLLAQAVALTVVEPARDADALAVRRVDHVAAGDREVHREPRALGLERVLDDLHDDLLAGLQQIGDLRGLAPGAAAAARRLDARQHDLIDVQEAVLLQADVDERGLEAGEHVVDAPLVDVADDRAGAAALQVELGDRVAGGRDWQGAGGGGSWRWRCVVLRADVSPAPSSSATRVSPRSTLTNTCFFNLYSF